MSSGNFKNLIKQVTKALLHKNVTGTQSLQLISKRSVSMGSKISGQGKLADRVAIVTGSTLGIGFSAAKRLADEGAKVVICSRKEENVNKALDELKLRYSSRVAGTVCHVGSEKDRNHLVNFTLENYGRIDYLISNAAVNPYVGPFMEMKESHWDKILDTNIKAHYLLTQKVVPHMMKNNQPDGDRGAIVYVSSIAAYFGPSNIGAYSVSKAALLGLCKSMSMELGPERIRVNSVVPGVIRTKFSGVLENTALSEHIIGSSHLKRSGQPDEIGGVIGFLCGPDASYITGENLVVAGGFHCKL